MNPIRKLGLVAVMTVTGVWAVSARAGGVQWSVGVHAPIGPGVAVGTVVSGGPYAPVVVAPAPVLYPPPVYVPAPVVYGPPVYGPPPVVVAPVWVGGRWIHRHPHHYNHGYYGWRNGYRGPPYHAPRHPGRQIRY